MNVNLDCPRIHFLELSSRNIRDVGFAGRKNVLLHFLVCARVKEHGKKTSHLSRHLMHDVLVRPLV